MPREVVSIQTGGPVEGFADTATAKRDGIDSLEWIATGNNNTKVELSLQCITWSAHPPS